MPRKPNPEIASFIIANVSKHPEDVVTFTAEHFGISRQSAHGYVRTLVETGQLNKSGTKRDIRYTLPALARLLERYSLEEPLDEDAVWRQAISPKLQWLPKNILDICNYGFTEILNNAVDHSNGAGVDVFLYADAESVTFSIDDNGIGIFRKLKEKYELADERQALLELAKGKATSDPTRHSGEGIFFTSRMFDTFRLASRDLILSRYDNNDWLFDNDGETVTGTSVYMKIFTSSSRTIAEVFDRFTTDLDEYGFSKTIVPVALAQVGDDNLVSRSQAKRVLSRIDRFKEVIFDFKGVGMVGQAFADEIFRVFPLEHPNIQLVHINAVPAVERMIRRALANANEP